MSTGEVVELNPLTIKSGPEVRQQALDHDHIAALRLVLHKVPPIIVRAIGDEYQIIDGRHRTQAAAEEVAHIRAVVVELSDAEAWDAAWRANGDHGLPYTLADRRAEARRRIADDAEQSDRSIAVAVGLSPTTVGKLRPPADPPSGVQNGHLKRKGADGKTYTRNPKPPADDQKSPGLGVGGPSVEPPAPAGPAPDDDRSEGGADPAPRHLAPVPDRTDQEAEPTVGDLLTWWPTEGQWIKDKVLRGSNAGMAAARVMDRRSFRDGEIADLMNVPLERRPQVIAAARHQADTWASLADALGHPSRPRDVEEA